MIYFLQPVDGGAVKIGTTIDVNVSDKVIAALAKAVGVKPAELTTPKRKGEE